MFDQYKIAVKLALADELSAPLALVASKLRMAEEAAGKLQSRMASMKAYFSGGIGLIGAGATIAAPLIYAIDKAAELQKQMIAIQIATRGTTEQMDSMRRAMEQVSGVTVFSAVDVAKMAKLVATGTGLGAPQVQSLLPVYAKFADVQLLMKDTPYQTSVVEAIRLAHTAQHYDAASLASYMDLLTKATLIEPGSLTEIGNALKYSQPIGKTALGIDDQNIVIMTAFLNRMGLSGTRGGTNLAAAMTRSIPGIFGSGLLTGKSNEALKDMSMVDAQGHAKFFKDGKFDSFTWIGLLSEFVQRQFASHPEAIARQNIMKDFQHAFGTQGNKVPSLLAAPGALDQLKTIGEQFAQYGGVQSMQKEFADKSVWQQYMNAKTNFQNAMMEMGITLLPLASRELKKLNIYLGEFTDWMSKNPEKVHQYAKYIGELSVALAGLGIVSIATSGIIGLRIALTALNTMAVAAAGATVGFAGAMSKISRIGTAAGLGYAVGTVAYDNFIAGTKLDDWLGEQGAKFMASFFGSQTAKDSLAAHHVKGYSTVPNAPLHAGPGAAPSFGIDFSKSIAPSKSPILNLTTNLNVDGRTLATVVNKVNAKALSGPQTGPSSFDGSLMATPAGGVGL